ncbi:MAG: type IV pilus secretin PilQ [candidate division Zixibacteria bacterium]|nr:type IV pilus secretin PilQ [candidate division Zixibacteria bacterium]
MKAYSKKQKWLRLSGVAFGAVILLLASFSMVGSTGSRGQGKPITALTLQNADIHSVLSFLADYGGVNIVASPQVNTTVTMTLQEVTWRQALDILLQTYSLSGVEESGYIRVVPTQDYMNEQMQIEKHKSDQKTLITLETEVIPVKYGTASDMVKSVKAVLSQRGTVDTDDRTNSLVIRDIPENIERVKELVNILDKETDQIKISTRLLEVESGAMTELGINWSIISREAADLLEGAKPEASFDQKANKVSDPIGTFTYATAQTDFDLEATVSALVSSNKGKIVAHPEITTVDNKEAFIQMGQKIPIKQFDQSGNVVITFTEVGTILRVTPHITSENRILLKLKPERSSYTFDANGVIINTNNAETNVVVENGQTAVIGGLTTQEEIKNYTGLPILKDIPLIGYLFRYTKTQIANRDLVIFVTPTIVTEQMHSSTNSPK